MGSQALGSKGSGDDLSPFKGCSRGGCGEEESGWGKWQLDELEPEGEAGRRPPFPLCAETS